MLLSTMSSSFISLNLHLKISLLRAGCGCHNLKELSDDEQEYVVDSATTDVYDSVAADVYGLGG